MKSEGLPLKTAVVGSGASKMLLRRSAILKGQKLHQLQ